MKIVKAKPFSNITVSIVIVAATITFSSCLKTDPPVPVAYLNVIHSSPGTGSLNFSLDQNRLNYQNFNYQTYTGYLRAYTGVRVLKVYEKEKTNALLTSNLTLSEDKHYSVFIIDTLGKMNAVLLRDSTRNAGADSVRIRFANMSPDVPAIDFYIKGETTPVVTNVAYKSAVNYISRKKANDVEFEIKQTGQSAVLATSEKMDLLNRKIYTVWSSGYKSETGSKKIAVSEMVHY